MKLEVLSERRPGSRVVRVLLRLTASPPKVSGSRRPVNLALLIDRSSSMKGPRLKQAIDAARELIGRLGPKDRLSIIAFDATPQLLCEPGPVTDERRLIMERALDDLESGVGTNLAAALRTGADLIRSSFVRNAIARVLLLTDGQASVGITDNERLGAISAALAEAGVTTTTMGLGQGYDDELLIDIADRGSGSYYYIANASDIGAAFGSELEGVFSISARETELRLVPDDAIESLELSHKLPCQPFPDGLLVKVGDVSCFAPRHILFRMTLAEGSECASAGTIAVTYKDAEGDDGQAFLTGIPLNNSDDRGSLAVVAEDLSLRVAHAVDQAWARRTSGNSGHALLALREVHQAVMREQEAERCTDSVATQLLEDLASAEIAIGEGAAELERVKRGLREKSQMTKVGHSVLHQLRHPPRRDD